MQGTGRNIAGWVAQGMRRALMVVLAAGLVAPAVPSARAADRVVPVIDGFGPYKLGMPVAQAKAADQGAKMEPCGEVAEGRQCLILNAEVFQEPAVLYAVLDQAGGQVERILAKLDPQLTRRRAYRCIRLSEKVFALLVVVYGSRYKQSYDQNRRPLPAVAWDGEVSGRLIFEAKCRTHDEGNPLISVVERYPDGVKPPKVAAAPKKETEAAGQGDGTVDAAAANAAPLTVGNRAIEPGAGSGTEQNVSLAPAGDQPPPPVSVPVGPVEERALGAPDTSGAVGAADRMALLTRELAHAKGKAEPVTAPPAATALPAPEITTEVTEAAPVTETPGEAPSQSAEAPRAGDQGRYTVPLDVAPPVAAVQSDQQTIAIGETQGIADAAAPAPTPPVAEKPVAVDPGPVTVARADQKTASPVAVPKVAPEPVAKAAVVEKSPSIPPVTVPVTPSPVETTAPTAEPVNRQAARRPAIEDVPAPAATPSPSPATQPFRIASLPPEVRPPDYREAYEPPEPTDLEAPEPFAMPEEEAAFQELRDSDAQAPGAIETAVQERLAAVPAEPAPSAPLAVENEVAKSGAEIRRTQAARDAVSAEPAPVSLLSVARGNAAAVRPEATPKPATDAAAPPPATVARSRETGAPTEPPVAATEAAGTPPADTAVGGTDTDAGDKTASVAPSSAKGWGNAKASGFKPVLSGGWRRKAPVPPVRPWRERAAPVAGSATDA